ncbi:MAG: ABC transporter permease [Chlamydiia bacterium]|nr:ABC transporter permease [Chlamydiia bacterium]
MFAVFLRYFFVLKKGLHQLCDLFYWPAVDILLWGLTSVYVQDLNNLPNFPLILMTALVFWQVVWRGSTDISVSLLQELWSRNLVNLFSTPLKVSEWIGGMLLLGLCKLCCTILFGSLFVYVLYSLNVFEVGWLFLPFVASLLVFGWSVGFLASGFIIYWGNKLEMLAWMTPYLFAPFSAVFYPVHVLPKWAQIISFCLPTTYIFEGMRSILHTGVFPEGYFLMSIALNLLCLTASLYFFHHMFQKSMEKGLARLE